MANLPFDRTILNVRERPLSSDLDQAQSELDYALRQVFQQLFAVRTGVLNDAAAFATGFIGDAFKPRISSPVGMTVQLASGIGFRYDPTDVPTAIGGVTGLDDRSPYKPLVLLAPQTLTVPAADPVNPRIDIIEVKQDRRAQDPSSRDILDPATGIFTPNLVNKILSFVQDGRTSTNGAAAINYKTGTPAGVPVAPAVTAGYTKIAEVDVPALAASISAGQIRDLRTILYGGGVRRVAGQVSVVYNGITGSVDQLVAPPGVQLAITSPVLDAAKSIFFFAVLAGNLPTSGRGTARVQVSRDTTVATTNFDPVNFAELCYAQYTTLSSAQALAIRTNNVGVDAATGQPALLVGFRIAQLSGGVYGSPAVGTYRVSLDADV